MRSPEKEGAACLFKHRPHDHRVLNAFSEQQLESQLARERRNYPSALCAGLIIFGWILTDQRDRHARYIIIILNRCVAVLDFGECFAS